MAEWVLHKLLYEVRTTVLANTKPPLRKDDKEREHASALFGKVAEWLKAVDSKSTVGAISPRVRIPPFPHNELSIGVTHVYEIPRNK